MKKRLFKILGLALLLFSCSESATVEATDAHASTSGHETEMVNKDEEIINKESDELAFNGVQKGDFTLFGHTDINETGAVSSEEMFSAFNEKGEFTGKVNVTINEICQKAGCWINIQKTETENLMVFFKDHYTIPIESSGGKSAVIYGSLVSDTLTVDFQKHLLDDSKAAGENIEQADYDAITEDKIDLSFTCESILIKD